MRPGSFLLVSVYALPEPVDTLSVQTAWPPRMMCRTCAALLTSIRSPSVACGRALEGTVLRASAVAWSTRPLLSETLKYFWKAMTAWLVASP